MIFEIVHCRYLDVVEFETTIDKRKKKPVAVNITPASSEIVGENRVEGTIAVVSKQQISPSQNGVRIVDREKDLTSIRLIIEFLRFSVFPMEK